MGRAMFDNIFAREHAIHPRWEEGSVSRSG